MGQVIGVLESRGPGLENATFDSLGRPVRDLRISVTDRCNFRCVYCMPKEVFGPDHQFMPRAEVLTEGSLWCGTASNGSSPC